jgi:RHS repeat-associated protein
MATTAQLSENTHPGFEGIKAALCLAEMEANSNPASGMQPCLRQNGTGSRCSGKERDGESGLDYFLARYYSGAQGRFTSPDPENAGAFPDDPQSWNAYAYARNNPLKYTDPMGLSYRLCDTSGNCMDNYSNADFEKNFKNGAGIVTSGSETFGVIYAGGNAIGTYEYIDDCPVCAMLKGAFTDNQLPKMYEQRAEQNLRQGNYLAYALDKIGTYIFPQNYLIDGPLFFAGGIKQVSVVGKALSIPARKALGRLLGLEGETVASVILSRGGNASTVREAGHWAYRTLGDVAEAAAGNDRLAAKALKLAKQAAAKAQKF